MVAPVFDCNPNRLKQLLDDHLSGEQQAEIVAHLDACAACRKTLESLAADQIWWERLRHLPADGNLRPTKPPAREEKNSGRTVSAHDIKDTPDDGMALDFLDASDEPAHLGRIGPFEVTEVLGRGGMGIVLKGIDASLNRPVAIKVLAPHFASSGAARKRFAREAQAAAAVVHDHVVAIHSVGAWKGLPYLVMSYVPGRSLQEFIDAEGPLDVKQILRIGMQTALGLTAAHAQGLVHRDVKPANILLENGVNHVRITDFGLARAIDDASLTQSGVITGTPQYMSPEQSRSEAVDHRSDLFSLGSTLYAMCAGHAPFRSDSPMAVLLRIREEQPRPLRAINPDVPVWLAAIIEKLHAKVADRRFQSAAEVADLLGRFLAHLQQPETNPLPTMIADSSAGKPSRKFAHKMITAAVLSLFLAGGAAAVRWPFLGDDTGRDQSAPREDSASPNREKPAANTQTDRDVSLIQVDDIRRQTERLDAELHQPVRPSASNDAGDALLKQARQRLDKLERELSPSRP